LCPRNSVVKNIGTAPTPEGVIIGVAFTVNGKVVGWSDTVKTALTPGASVTCAANGGPGWTAAPGKHTVQADVDNIDRFPELNEENNRLDKTTTIGAP
jgi:subtilase family serine protease